MSIRRERRRLARAFQAVLLAAGTPTMVIACSSSGPPAGVGAKEAGAPSVDAAPDAVTQTGDADAGDALPADAAPPPPRPDAAGVDAARPPPIDAGNGGCYAGAYEIDSGPDANPLTDVCAYVYGCGLNGTGLVVAGGCQVLQLLPDGDAAPFPQMTCWLEQDAGCDDDAFAPGEEAGGVTILCTPCPTGGGRRPAGLRPRRSSAGATALGRFLASLAFEEDASVVAFGRMQVELAALGAPATIAEAAGRAAKDEARHARTMASLAIARQGRVTRARVRRLRARSTAAIAAENAAEGCVRETYGALVARWQATHAEDEELRGAFTRIAADEARHAALSWALARWIEPRLDAKGARRVARSRARALRALEETLAVEPPPELVRLAGLPTAFEARALLSGMSRALGLAPPRARAGVTRAARRGSPPPAAPSP